MLNSSAVLAKKAVIFAVVLLHPYSQINPQTRECEGQTIAKTQLIFAKFERPLKVLCFPPYRFIKEFNAGNIDLTINTKINPHIKAKALFLDPPFRMIKLNLYTKNARSPDRTIAAIKGFDYGGKRLEFTQNRYELLDLPSATSSLQAFLRGETNKLLFYDPQMAFFVSKKLIQLDNSIKVEELDTIYTHFAIFKNSSHKQVLNDYIAAYANAHNTQFFID
ncbi:hypothetical protein [Paraglaciecola aestuariivivens]